jgi:ribosomal protein S18 acetylase RimI-like enzyme
LLLREALQHAKKNGIEKVELGLYSTNASAVNLYKKFGFQQEGLIKNYRKLEGVYFDCILMAKFL